MKTKIKKTQSDPLSNVSQNSQIINLRSILKGLLCGIAFLLLSYLADCQISAGILGGPNFSTQFIELEGRGEMYWRVNYGIGAIVEVPVSDHVSLAIEPMYLKKGSRVEAIMNIENYIFTNTYLEIPVLAKYSFGNKLRPYLLAGPSMGILLKADFGGNYLENDYSSNFLDVTRKLDISLAGGAGISYNTGSVIVFCESQYTFGLVNTSVNGEVEVLVGDQIQRHEIKDETIKNRGIQFMVGVCIPLGR
jgi:hypothetical protein